ncbi:MAG: 1-acyl-sn-glycerol-3-phosphate acyltransferase [Paracoccaceae bacterium]
MSQSVSLPLWLLVLILAFAGVTFASHFLFPSVRWFFRRRMERVVARLNARLQRPIQPFKLMRRHDMIMRLIHDPLVMEAVVEEARASGVPEQVVLERARRYAREIVPAFSASIYFGFAARASRWVSRMLYHVRVGHFDSSEYKKLDREATIIFVMNHRSNMDYVLVTHLIADRSALSYAVGEWARVWPLSWLVRAMGAYFIRRSNSSTLYRRVLAQYVRMATDQGVPQAIFPEGGLSLTGALAPPKLGLLAYIIGGQPRGGRDVIFVPVALSYDRVMEDRVLTEAAATGVRRFPTPVLKILAFGLRNLWRRLRGRFKRFGYAAVSFGTPQSLESFMAANPANPAAELAELLMARIAKVMTVLPVPLVAAALGADRTITRAALLERATKLASTLKAQGASVHLPRTSALLAAESGLDALCLRGLLLETNGKITLPEANFALIAYYAASVAQAQNAVAASLTADSNQNEMSET